MRIGVLTAGGDAPGLNAAIRAIGEMAFRDGHEIIGVANGWAGLASDYAGAPLTAKDLRGVIGQGGTLLGTARYNLDSPPGGRDQVLAAIGEHFDALIAIGGDGTQRISNWLAARGAPIVGVPKTLDNDLMGTDYCIGFDTAISIVAESLDRLYTTAASHHRVMVVETMGRSTGWVAALGGLAGGADMIVIPEFPVTMDDIVSHLEQRRKAGLAFSIVVVAEGVNLSTLGGVESSDLTAEGIGGIRLATRGVGQFVASQIERRGDFEVRTTVLGHLQRGGSPTAHDRIWATRVGAGAYDAVIAGQFGMIPVVRNDAVSLVPLSVVAEGQRKVPREIYDLCALFF
ncbi:MAG TPA: ATP-dependent 6-phosphofructokinase [Acidimicrobiales bacterium]|nr:ATP-dependent 6-phosphofructokinase [Acidimicrobiales bacterium]